MTKFTYSQGIKLKLPKVWFVGLISNRMKESSYFFDNKAEANEYYMKNVVKNPYLIFFEEWNLSLKRGYYNMKTIKEYRSSENKKHLEKLWGE